MTYSSPHMHAESSADNLDLRMYHDAIAGGIAGLILSALAIHYVSPHPYKAKETGEWVASILFLTLLITCFSAFSGVMCQVTSLCRTQDIPEPTNNPNVNQQRVISADIESSGDAAEIRKAVVQANNFFREDINRGRLDSTESTGSVENSENYDPTKTPLITTTSL
jgi:hypothetical protein